ncbi:hypothetical protein FGB62_181g011 [Gracilaria domingensis]|nr:hypothetical protein FGB62_181g011 [Gracilaria domingensis]
MEKAFKRQKIQSSESETLSNEAIYQAKSFQRLSTKLTGTDLFLGSKKRKRSERDTDEAGLRHTLGIYKSLAIELKNIDTQKSCARRDIILSSDICEVFDFDSRHLCLSLQETFGESFKLYAMDNNVMVLCVGCPLCFFAQIYL